MLFYRLLSRLSALVLQLRLALSGGAVLAARFALPVPPRGTGPLIWLHGASNGELTASRRLIVALQARHPGFRLLITANSVTGRDLAKGWGLPATAVQLAPYDDSATITRFLDTVKPVALVVVENELWPNRLRLCAARGIPVFVVSARLSERSVRRWRIFSGLARHLMAAITWLAPQDAASRDRLIGLGLDPARVGPIMVLKSAAAAAKTDPLPLPRTRTVLAASTHEGEEEIILDAFAEARRAMPELHLILAPRHPQRRDTIEAAIRARGFAFATRSRGEDPAPGIPVYLADTLGEMDRWYAAAGITFVGGSLTDRGGHTPFEPAAHGSAILTGPHTENAAPAFAALLATGGAVEVHDAQELAAAVLALTDPARQARQVAAARGALAGFGAEAAITAFLDALDAATGNPT